MNPKADWNLEQWLVYIEASHPSEIELGLERTREVYQRLSLNWDSTTVITVAGTNGKGTTCTLIEQVALATLRSVGVYSSPHIHQYEERVRVNGQQLSAEQHVQAFWVVEQARADIPLTYFEFGTLAALVLLAQAKLDCVLLEVGLGGRLDATNVVDSDLAVITSIGLDHQAFLGDTRELVATEKAGVMRPHKPAVIGEYEPPYTLREAVIAHQASAFWVGQDFSHSVRDGRWHYHSLNRQFSTSIPQIPHHNVATSVAVIDVLGWHISDSQLTTVIEQTKMVGRLETASLNGEPDKILFDVAHNPHAANYLKIWLEAKNISNISVIVAMMADKDVWGTLQPLADKVKSWHCLSLDIPRALPAKSMQSLLLTRLHELTVEEVPVYYNAQEALVGVNKTAHEVELVVVLGSFFTVSAVQQALIDFNSKDNSQVNK